MAMVPMVASSQGATMNTWSGDTYISLTKTSSVVWGLRTGALRTSWLSPVLDSLVNNVLTARISDSLKALSNGSSWAIIPSALRPAGTNGYVLTTSGGVATWAAASSGSTMNNGDSLSWYGLFRNATIYWACADTASLQLIDNVQGGGGAWRSFQELFIADYPLIYDRIEVRHSYDSVTAATGAVVAWRFRDTAFTITVRDSIPAGMKVFAYYAPASITNVYNGTGRQVVGVFWMAPNSVSANLIGDLVQVPLINKTISFIGVVDSHRGIRSGHGLRATFRFVRKIPGVIY